MHLKFGMALLASAVVFSSVQAQAPANPRVDALGDPLPDGAIARLGTTRFKHTPVSNPLIQAAAYSPDGKFIVSRIAAEGPLRLWDAATGTEVIGPWNAVDKRYSGMVFSPDSKVLVTALSPGASPALAQPQLSVEIELWDIAAKKQIRTINGHPNYVRTMAFIDGGKTLISAGNGAVCWWDVATGKQNRLWKPFNDEQRAGKDGMAEFKYFVNPCLSPDGHYLAVEASWRTRDRPGTLGGTNKEVFGFDLTTDKIRWRTAATTQEAVLKLAFSGDSKRVAIAIGPDHVEVRECATGKLVGGPVNGEFLRNSAVGGFALSKDGATLATAGKTSHLSIWNVEDPDPKKLRRLPGRLAQNRVNSTECIAFSPDDKVILVGVDFDMQLYDFATLKEAQPLEGHRGWVTHVAFSTDGKQLHTGAAGTNPYPKEMASWDVTTWKRLQLTSSQSPQRWPNIGIFSPDQRYFTGKNPADRFIIHEMATAKALGNLEVPAKLDNGRGFFSPSGNLFVLLYAPDEKVGGKAKRTEYERLYAVPSGKLLCELPLSLPSTTTVATRGVAFSADERLVALLGRNDALIHIVETATGKQLHVLGTKNDQPFDLNNAEFLPNFAFSPDGKLLAVMGGRSKAIHIWDVPSGKERMQLPVQSNYFAWSADSRLLAVGQDRNVHLFELASRGARRELKGHEGPVRAVAFSPDGKVLASGSVDTTVLIWDLTPRPTKDKPLDAKGLEKCWQDLAGLDAAKAYLAMVEMTASPKDSVACIKDKVKPAAAVDPKHIESLITQLDDNQFKVRQKAFTELNQIGEQIVPAIVKALAANPPLETRLRLEELRTRMSGMVLQGERLQGYRAIEVLEVCGSPEARQLLQTLAGGASGALLTISAQEALVRTK